MKGVNVGGKNSNNLRYADDTELLAGNEKVLSELTSKINEVGKQCGKKINIKKTKAMIVSKTPNSPKLNIAIDGQHSDACEMWVFRRVLNIISRTEKITNEEVLRRMSTGREIVRQFKTRRLQYLGDLIRHNSSQLQLIEGKIEGEDPVADQDIPGQVT